MRFLRTNTAVRVTVGPFFDKTDGVTPETALTVTSCKLTFMVDDGNVPTLVLDTNPTASGGANDMVHVTGDDAGFYDLELAAGNVNYLGRAMLAITDAATHCPVFHEFMILPAVVYDAMVLGTDNFDVSVTQWTGTNVAAPDTAGYPKTTLKSGTGAGEVSLSSGAVLLQATQTGVTIPTVTTLTNAPSDSSGVTTLLSRLSALRAGYLDNLSAGAVALASTFTGITSLAQWLGMLAGKQTGNSTARTEIRATGGGSGTYDETTDSLEANRDNIGTAGAGLTAADDAVITALASPADSSGVTTLLSRLSSARAGYLDNLSAGAVALASTFSGITSLAQWLGLIAGKQTGNSTARTELRATGGGSGTFDETTDSLEANRDNIGTAGAGLTSADDAVMTRLGSPAGASVSADIAAVKSDSAAILVDTNELQTDLTNGGRLDLIFDDILTDTGTTLQGELDGIQADTEDIQSRLPAALVSGRIDATVDGTGMESGAIQAILTASMTESYNSDGSAMTLAQALYLIAQRLTEFSISGTTITVKKLDGSTSAYTLTLDDDTSPTSSTRAT